MAKTFYSWLRQQRWRDDEVGDLARDVWDDRKNIRDHSVSGIKYRMLTAGACFEALEALDTAVAEFHLKEVNYVKNIA